MFCKKCGAQLADDSLFCAKCGERVATDNTEMNTPKTKEYWMLETIKTTVNDILKSPRSATYGEMCDYAEDAYGRVYVNITVDAQNSYGALLRMKFNVLFDNVRNDGPCVILKIEEDMTNKSFLASVGSRAMGDWKVFHGFGKTRAYSYKNNDNGNVRPKAQWTCKECGTRNLEGTRFCKDCGKYK